MVKGTRSSVRSILFGVILFLSDIQLFVCLCDQLRNSLGLRTADSMPRAYGYHRDKVRAAFTHSVYLILQIFLYLGVCAYYQNELIASLSRAKSVSSVRNVVERIRYKL